METNKTNIVIVDYKDTSATRSTFITKDHGKMSAFKNEGSNLIQDLKDHTNRLISVDVSKTVKDGSTYFNIRAFNGAVAGGIQETKPYFPSQDVRTQADVQAETIKPMDLFNERDKDTSFYTAYAKDVFIALIEDKDHNDILLENCMKIAIELVKQARDAFSQ